MKGRLLIDVRIADRTHLGMTGMERYSLEISAGLLRARPDWRIELLSNRPDLLPSAGSALRTTRWPTRSGLGRNAWLQLGAPFTVRPHRGDVWFGTAYVLPLWWRGPSVVAIHDLTYVLIPDRYLGRARAARLAAAVRGSARRASAILCGSQETRGRIVEHLGVPAERVVVTAYGVKDVFFEAAAQDGPAATTDEPPYALFVGTFEARKGLDTLHAALRAVNGSGPPRLRLVLAGRPGWGADEALDAMRADPAVVFVDRPSDEELAGLYRRALAVVYPSAMEGFGLPVAEAMAIGTPVIASDLGCIREFAGDVPLYIQPGDTAGLSEHLVELLDGSDFATRLADGREYASELRWDRAAERTAAVIERVSAT